MWGYMNNIMKSLAISAIALASLNVSAEIVATDWKVVGDSKSFVHVETGVEWLRLTETKGLSLNQMINLLSSDFNGWRLATRNEVNVLMTEITGLDMSGEDSHFYGGFNSSTHATATVLSDTLGYTTGQYSYGLFQDDGTVFMSGGGIKNSSNTYNEIQDDMTSVSYTIDFVSPDYGIFIASDGGETLTSQNDPSINANNVNNIVPPASVPLPASLGLLGLALFGMRFRRRE